MKIMADNQKIEQLKIILKDLFQFESSDLDFGIYRIIDIKRKEITEFIDKELFEIINVNIKTLGDDNELKKKIENQKRDIEKTFECNIQEAKTKYFDLGIIKEYIKMEEMLKATEKESEIEGQIYDDIINFFSRYYDKGDFISKRRYSKENKYAIPYNGEEFFFYWANNDQYYIKTTQYFKNYPFKAGALRVSFEVVSEEVEEEKGNIKDTKDKHFIFYNTDYDVSKKLVTVLFGYRELSEEETKAILELTQKKKVNKDVINVYNLKKINEKLGLYGLSEIQKKHKNIDGKESEKSELEWHLNKYTTKNTTDYFIHKNLKRFLIQELDFYIKNEILHIDDIQSKEICNKVVDKIKTFKEISLKIIEFLAQIEDFQKMLWEKRKFVLSTDYCITLDYVPEKYYSRILENNAQLEEWVNLYSFDIQKEADLLKGKLTEQDKSNDERMVEVLKQNPTLVLDTKFYDIDFKYQILSEIDNLDEKTNGILINSENFQALNLLLNKYKERIKCCYIDPPYNAKSSEILYKNNYKHSSWACLMQNRLYLSKFLSTEDGSHIIAIDENEQELLGHILKQQFDNHDITCVVVIHNPKGIQGNHFSFNHEYAYFIVSDKMKYLNEKVIPPEEWEYDNLRKWGKESDRNTAKNCFYPIYVKNDKIIGYGEVCNESFHPRAGNIYEDDRILVYPIDGSGDEKKWRYAKDSIESILDLLKVNKTREGEIQIFKAKSTKSFKTVWDDPKYIAGDYGTRVLTEMGFVLDKNLYPKSVFTVMDSVFAVSDNDSIVIDYFAGSGTTGHAVMKLNKEENESDRKFILIEMGQYFETILKPRILKAIFSDKWKEGKAIDHEANGSKKQIIKYQSLEQYEDSLLNIHFTKPNVIVKESKDYKIKYMFKFESKNSNVFLNLDSLDNPFEYKLEFEEKNEKKERNIDLVETFNYLAGITVKSIKKMTNDTITYFIVKGYRNGKDVIVIWRNKPEEFDPVKDKKFIEKEILKEEYDEILVNGNSLVHNAKSIDEIFKTNMF